MTAGIAYKRFFWQKLQLETWVKLLTDLQIFGCELSKNALGGIITQYNKNSTHALPIVRYLMWTAPHSESVTAANISKMQRSIKLKPLPFLLLSNTLTSEIISIQVAHFQFSQ